MSRLGMADLGIATLNDMRENAGMIASLDRGVPVIADADTCYGGKKVNRTSPFVAVSSDYLSRSFNGRSDYRTVYASRRCSFPP